MNKLPEMNKRPPHQTFHPGRPAFAIVVLAALVMPLMVSAPAAGASGQKLAPIAEHPGFLDFSELGFSDDAENLKVEVNLQDAVLAFVTETLRPSDAELAEALAKIRSIRFQLFEIAPGSRAKASTRARALADRLESRGWQRVVRIQEDQVQSFLHLKMVGNRILGLTVMFLGHKQGEGDTFGFINIAGEIDPAQLGRIGQRFDIEVLEEAQRKLGAGSG